MDLSRFSRSSNVEQAPTDQTPWYLQSFLPFTDPSPQGPLVFGWQPPANALSAEAGINDIQTPSMLRRPSYGDENEAFSKFLADEFAKLKLQQ